MSPNVSKFRIVVVLHVFWCSMYLGHLGMQLGAMLFKSVINAWVHKNTFYDVKRYIKYAPL